MPGVPPWAARRLEESGGEKSGGADKKRRRTPTMASVLMPMPESEASAVPIGEAVTGADVCDGRSVELPDGRSERIAASAVHGAGAGMARPVSGASSRVRAWRRSGMGEHRARRPRQFDLDCEDGRRKSSRPDQIVRRTFAPWSQPSLPPRRGNCHRLWWTVERVSAGQRRDYDDRCRNSRARVEAARVVEGDAPAERVSRGEERQSRREAKANADVGVGGSGRGDRRSRHRGRRLRWPKCEIARRQVGTHRGERYAKRGHENDPANVRHLIPSWCPASKLNGRARRTTMSTVQSRLRRSPA